MKHLKGFNTLNRTHSHRKAMFRNMVQALIKNERITTTLAKAKELRRVIEKIITKAKVKDLHNIRIINRNLKDEKLLVKLFDDIAPRYLERNGGYTRIIKLAKRKGDGADMCFIELVEEKTKSKKKKTKDAKAEKKVETPKAETKKTEKVEESDAEKK